MAQEMARKKFAAPAGMLDEPGMRVQEDIHGHRLIPEQEPYMILLEALSLCAAHPLGSVETPSGQHEDFNYVLLHRKKLRFLLFQDRHLEQVSSDDHIHEHEKWAKWKARVNQQYDPDGDEQDHFAYLDDKVNHRLDALLQAVRLLRSRELDVMHNRRWTSRFLAVTGPDLIMTDMRESNGKFSADRRFFGRGGELIYLMLNRSSRAKSVGVKVASRLLAPTDPMNDIARKLSDPNDNAGSNTRIGYLPCAVHPAYERLAEDWEQLLSLDGLPSAHLFEPLFRITGLNLFVYLAERAQEESNTSVREPILVDMTDGADARLREISKAHLNRHRHEANRAVRSFVEREALADGAWQIAVEQDDPNAAREALKGRFKIKKLEGRPPPVGEQLDDLINDATTRDKNNIHTYLLPLTKGIGLVTARQRVGSWFAMDDSLLFALVVANVSEPMELRHFAKRLYERYGIVIGPEEARQAFDKPEVGIPHFEGNLAALEKRMTRIALTRRLSDDCAFVNNPYRARP